MPATIKIKNSSTTGAVPTSSDLVQGELAVNVTDLGLYTENASGTVVKLNAPSIDDKNTGATKHLTISTGGNMGLGVTPSAWGSPFKAFQFGSNGGSLNYRTDSNQAVELALNWFYDGTNSKYINSNWATRYRQFSGAHEWYTAASGTAGNTITFTQAMTLDASGNLGVGTTSPGNRLQVVGATGPVANFVGNNANNFITVSDNNNTDTISVGAIGGGNAYLYSGSGKYTALYAGATERARIDSSGNLLVGTTSAGAAGSNAYTAGSLCLGGATVTAGYKYCVINVNTGGSGSGLSYQYAGAERAAVYWNQSNDRLFAFVGNSSTGVYMSNSATSWTANSDERLKTDLVPIENAAQKVSTLRAVTGRYKTDEEGVSRSFLIAQDVQAVLPEAVSVGSMPMSEDQTEYLGVSYTDVIPLLVAAIKELKAEIDVLKGQA